MSKPTRSDCFFTIGELNAYIYLLENAKNDPHRLVSAAESIAKTLTKCQSMLEELAPDFNKKELASK